MKQSNCFRPAHLFVGALLAFLLLADGGRAQTSGTAAPGGSTHTVLGDTGMTPEQLRQKLRDAGQSDEAIENLMRRGGAMPRRAAVPAAAPAPEPRSVPDSVAHIAPPAPAGEPEPFGFEMFHWAPTTFEPLQYGPVDEDYPLGPGDELALTLWGDDQLALALVVSREGFVTLPDVGQIAVSGLTLEAARGRVRAALARAYSGLRPDGQRSSTFISLSLGKLRSIQVFLLGQVVRPGSYTLSSVARVLNALYVAGGPSRDGSLRDVRVLRGGRIAASVDLYGVILGGEARDMPRLQNGDIVFVPPAERRVTVAGPFRRTGIFELHQGEQLHDLLRIAGGPLPAADLARAQIERILPVAQRAGQPGEGRIALDIRLGDALADSARDVPLMDADILTAFALSNRLTNVVMISGRGITRTGSFQFHPGMRVAELVAAAGGVTADAYLERALVTRTMADSSRMVLRFSPARALAGDPADNLELQAMDDLSIRSQWDLKERQLVTVHGLVRAPGSYELLDGMTLGDLLMRAGGLTDDALVVRAEISRIAGGGRLSDTLQIPLTRELTSTSPATAFVLQPHDAVFIRRDPNYTDQQYVTVLGEVRFPGTYSLTRRDERVGDLVLRSGGLTELAYPRGTTFVRAGGARLAIDLPAAMRSSRNPSNLVLQRGDTLTVPRFTPTVQVEGAVLSPVTALYQQGAGIGFYVTQASGFREDADRRGVVVISPSGHVRRRGDPEPGSRIVVPMRMASESRDHLKDFATLMSVLASAATTYFLVRQSSK